MKPLRLVATLGCVAVSACLGPGLGWSAPARRAVDDAEVVELGRFALGDPRALPLISQTMEIEIDGQHARTISNLRHENKMQGRVEGTTALQLAETARITAFSYWNGAERIVGEVLPKAIARTIYDETVGRRRDPGLLEQDGPGHYTLHVFPIELGERKRTQLVWDQWLEQHDGEIAYQTPLESPRAEIVIEMDDTRTISDLRSSSHHLDVKRSGGKVRVTARPRNDEVKELAMTWKVAVPPLSMHGWTHRDAGEDAYVLLHVAAPTAKESARVPKDVTLVLDESGSMEGEPLDNGKLAANAIVEKLAAGDRLNVVLFDDRMEALFDTPQPLSAEVRRKAKRFIDGAGNGGGTDVALALSAALERQGDDARPKSILLLTDGESPREPAFAAVEADKKDVRVFTVGVGAQVDTAALTRLADLKRGRYTAIPTASAIAPTMARLYDRMAAPVLVGLAIESEGPTLVRTYPTTLPDLFAGDELVVTARVQGDGRLDVKLTGTTASGPRVLKHSIDVPKKTERAQSRSWVGSMWARARIDDLLNRLALDSKDGQERIDEVTRLGVRYDIVTPYTSFLAIPESELTERTRDLLEQGRGAAKSGRLARRDMSRNIEEMRSVESAPVVNYELESDESHGNVLDPESADAPVLHSRKRSIEREMSAVSEDEADHASGGGRHRKGGCAHCNAGDATTDGMWLVLLVLLRRRWRSTRSGVPKA